MDGTVSQFYAYLVGLFQFQIPISFSQSPNKNYMFIFTIILIETGNIFFYSTKIDRIKHPLSILVHDPLGERNQIC